MTYSSSFPVLCSSDVKMKFPTCTYWTQNENNNLPMPYPLIASPLGSNANLYTWSLTSRWRMHPFKPFITGNFSSSPVVFPGPPMKRGSRKVILKKKSNDLKCEKQKHLISWKWCRKLKGCFLCYFLYVLWILELFFENKEPYFMCTISTV